MKNFDIYINTLFQFVFIQQALFFDCIIYKIFFQMLSNTASQFDKECASTLPFQTDSNQASSFDFAHAIDEFDLEQSCLLKLRSQRQKIEQLTKLYQLNERELEKRQSKEKELQDQIEKLSDMQAYKQDWTELKRDYDDLSKRFRITDAQAKQVKRQLKVLMEESEQKINDLIDKVHMEKTQNIITTAHWERVMEDKEEQILKKTRQWQQREEQLCQVIEKANQEIAVLKQSIEQKFVELEMKDNIFYKELKAKEDEIMRYQKVVQQMKRQNNQYRLNILETDQIFADETQQQCQIIDHLKRQLKMFKQDQKDKENQLYQYKQMIRKCDNKNQALQETVDAMKKDHEKFKANNQRNFKKITLYNEQEKVRLELFVEQLKVEIETQMKQKEQMSLQLKRIKRQIQRKEQQQKQRKVLLMSEFRQIDKMQKLVKKII